MPPSGAVSENLRARCRQSVTAVAQGKNAFRAPVFILFVEAQTRMIQPKKLARKFLTRSVPRHLVGNCRALDAAGRSELGDVILQRCRWGEMERRSKAFEDILSVRVEHARRDLVPWLDHIRPLSDLTILEIGCGTGPSLLAFAEQGASVTGLDIRQDMLEIARKRLELHGLEAELACGNAVDAHELLRSRHFDLIIFNAVLEHMTLEERLSSMGSTWDMLRRGDMWAVSGTPNRLWYWDGHSSHLPFFHWLPNDLARCYARFSPRESMRRFAASGQHLTDTDLERYGRSVSYHEFDLALRQSSSLNVISSAAEYHLRRRGILRFRGCLSHDARYAKALRRLSPGVHAGFFERYLALVIGKD